MNVVNEPSRLPLMKKSIQHFTDLDGDNCIYKFSGAASLWAAIGNGDSSLKWLNRSLEILPRFGSKPGSGRVPSATKNTFYSERENPTFESPISSSRAMLDMLIQSWGGIIHVFPAIPAAWKDASFYNLRTEGAFLVSAVRKEGKTQFIHIKSLAGAPCIIQTDLQGLIKVVGSPSTKLKQQNGLIELSLQKGEEVVIFTGVQPDSFEIKDLPIKADKMNSWGVRKKY